LYERVLVTTSGIDDAWICVDGSLLPSTVVESWITEDRSDGLGISPPYVDNSAKLTPGVLVGSGIVASLIATEPPIDKLAYVELPSESLKALANTSLVEVTISIVCDPLATAVRNELAMRPPELVGSSMLTLSDPKEDESAADGTSGTTIEILGDRVGSGMKDSIVVVGEARSDANSVEPKLLENENLVKEARTELVATS
jgi:hypothetical protein